MDTGFRGVIGSDGSVHVEQQVGSMRFNVDQGNFDQLL